MTQNILLLDTQTRCLIEKALTLYFPTSSTALSLSVLPSMPALYFYTVTPVTSDRPDKSFSFHVAYD